MRLLDNSVNPQGPGDLYNVGNVIRNGNGIYFVVVNDGDRVNCTNEKFGLVSLRVGRLQYHDGECWFDTKKELAGAFYDSDDTLLTGKITFDMD